LDYLQIVQQFVNMKAVLIAVMLTQLVKYFLPSPPETPAGERTTELEPGKWWTRLIPFCPIFLGMVFCYFIERDSRYTFDDVVKGFMSGALAGYLYRTTKVTLFGD